MPHTIPSCLANAYQAFASGVQHSIRLFRIEADGITDVPQGEKENKKSNVAQADTGNKMRIGTVHGILLKKEILRTNPV